MPPIYELQTPLAKTMFLTVISAQNPSAQKNSGTQQNLGATLIAVTSNNVYHCFKYMLLQNTIITSNARNSALHMNLQSK